MKYRKKPVVIEAVQWTDENTEEVLSFCCGTAHEDEFGGMFVHTLEGPMRASVGDFIIRGVKGEFYPCKPDIFWLTYEVA